MTRTELAWDYLSLCSFSVLQDASYDEHLVNGSSGFLMIIYTLHVSKQDGDGDGDGDGLHPPLLLVDNL